MAIKNKMETMDGNMAAAHVAYAFTEVAAIYPITPFYFLKPCKLSPFFNFFLCLFIIYKSIYSGVILVWHNIDCSKQN